MDCCLNLLAINITHNLQIVCLSMLLMYRFNLLVVYRFQSLCSMIVANVDKIQIVVEIYAWLLNQYSLGHKF